MGEFRCRDGTCIGNSSRCNQFVDCEDASDEMNCSEWCPLSGPSPASALLLPSSSPALLSAFPRTHGVASVPSQPVCPTLAPCLQAWTPLGFGRGGEASECKVWTAFHLKDTIQLTETHEGPGGPVVAREGVWRESGVTPHPSAPHQAPPTAAATFAWG